MAGDVVLRPLKPADIPAILAAVRESFVELSPWMPWCTPDFGERNVAEFIERVTEGWRAGLVFQFGVFAEDGEYLGTCGLNGLNVENRCANLGYWIRSSRTRRGLATLAVRKVVAWGFAETELERLEVLVAVGNLASQRVAERAGAEREGVLRRRLVLHGTAHDAVVFSFVRPR